MVADLGVLKTSEFTNISRSTVKVETLWVNRKRREFVSNIFETNKDLLKSFYCQLNA